MSGTLAAFPDALHAGCSGPSLLKKLIGIQSDRRFEYHARYDTRHGFARRESLKRLAARVLCNTISSEGHHAFASSAQQAR